MARIPYEEREDLDPEYQDLVVSTLQAGKTVNVYRAIGNNQEVLYGFREFLGTLWNDSGLTDRQREIVIMTVATEIGSEYEWHQHVSIAPDAGLIDEEIAAIASDDRRPFSDEEQALIAYARAVTRGRVTNILIEALQEYVDEETIVGATVTAAGYVSLGRVIDALGVEIEDDEFVGWDSE